MKSGKNNIEFNTQLKTGLLLLGVIISVVLLSIFFGEASSIEVNMDKRLQASTPTHILGTDNLGRDLFMCMVFGVGISLMVASLVVIFHSALEF